MQLAPERGLLKSRLGIALQVVAVAALAVTAYFSFLKPDDSGPLSGIAVDNGGEIDDGTQVVQAPPAERRRIPTSDARRSRRQQRASSVTIERIPADVAPAPPDVDSPIGAQYTSAAEQIVSRVRGGR